MMGLVPLKEEQETPEILSPSQEGTARREPSTAMKRFLTRGQIGQHLDLGLLSLPNCGG